MTRPDLTREATETAQDIAGEVHRLSEAAERTARAARDRAAEDVTEGVARAREAAGESVSEAADSAAARAEEAARAAEEAAADPQVPGIEAQALEALARLLEDMARNLRGSDVSTLSREATHLVQRHPVLTLAGAAAAGFAVARLARAGGSRSDEPGPPRA
ncbi:hypothetical protein [Rhodosalinus sp.]|uniref:hypothetical protein n=1 Tax=Rhodosalinus sp. TaxID=2047741 RepID=UPI003561A373